MCRLGNRLIKCSEFMGSPPSAVVCPGLGGLDCAQAGRWLILVSSSTARFRAIANQACTFETVNLEILDSWNFSEFVGKCRYKWSWNQFSRGLISTVNPFFRCKLYNHSGEVRFSVGELWPSGGPLGFRWNFLYLRVSFSWDRPALGYGVSPPLNFWLISHQRVGHVS